MNDLILKAKQYAQIAHDAAGCTYGDDNENYMVHLNSVYLLVKEYENIFFSKEDRLNTCATAFTHDLLEDAQQTFNDVKNATNKDVAKITLAVTDIPEENRLLRHLMTLPKTTKDYRAIILKLCDLKANSSYGKGVKNSMYKKYQKEWVYKRYILSTAINWYPDEINMDEFKKLLHAVDLSHGI